MKNMIAVSFLFLSLNSFASLTEQQQNYAMFCGSRADINELAASKGEKVTAKDLAELSSSRAPLLNVLRTGNKGIQELLKQGSAASTGPFGVIMTCGMINQLKNEIKAEGCYDLKTNSAVRDNGGIKACSDVLAKLPH